MSGWVWPVGPAAGRENRGQDLVNEFLEAALFSFLLLPLWWPLLVFGSSWWVEIWEVGSLEVEVLLEAVESLDHHL